MAQAPSRKLLTRLLSNKLSVVGFIFTLILIFTGLFAEFLSPYDPQEMMFEYVYKAPCAQFPLGTDALGRDILSRLIFGAQTSLYVGLGAALVALFIGVIFGGMAGYYGKTISAIFMRLADVQLSIPNLILLIVAAAVIGERSLNIIIIIIGVSMWPSLGRVTRSKVMDLKTRDFVEAARAAGVKDLRILWRHILPNGLGPITVIATLDIGSAIISESSLSFLGLGDPQAVSWGQMLTKGLQDMVMAPWITIFPGMAIFLSVWGLNMFGDALRDALDVES
jgi:peptide/nickel transport system permease protein